MKLGCVRITWGIAVCAWMAAFDHLPAQQEEHVIDGKPVSALLQQLKSDNRGLQMRAARALAALPVEMRTKIVPLLIPLLKSERENDKFVAAQTLGEYGPLARPAVSDLLPMLKGTQFERNRAAAAKALGQILRDAEPSAEVDQVADALAAKFNEEYDSYSDVRREAVYALGMIGPAARRCIPKLTRALTDFKPHSGEHGLVREAAAWTVGRMGPLAAEHVDRLISMIHEEGHKYPLMMWALGEIGPVHENVVPNMVDRMELRVRGPHVETCRQMRIYGLAAFEKFGEKATAAAPFLARTLREGSLPAEELTPTLKALKAIGPKAREFATDIRKYRDIANCRTASGGWAPREALEEIRRLARETEEAVLK